MPHTAPFAAWPTGRGAIDGRKPPLSWARQTARFAAWCGVLVAGHLALQRAGEVLPTPPPPGAAFVTWLGRADPVTTAFALLRLAAVAVCWYLSAVTILAVLARASGLTALLRLAEHVTLPVVRRALRHAIGAGVAVTIAGSTVPLLGGAGVAGAAPAPPAPPVVTMHVIDEGPPAPGTPDTSAAPVHADPGAPDPVPAPPEARPDPPPTVRMVLLDQTATTNSPAADPGPSADPPAIDQGPGAAPGARPAASPVPTAGGPAPTPPTMRVASDAPPPSAAPPVVTPADTGPRTGPPTERDAAPGNPVEGTGTNASDQRPDPPAPEPPGPPAPPAPAATDTPPPPPPPLREWTVQAGDHLWHVADVTVQRAKGGAATDAEVATYWRVLIEANRDRLVVPGDADLILPGQQFVLPPTALEPAPAPGP